MKRGKRKFCDSLSKFEFLNVTYCKIRFWTELVFIFFQIKLRSLFVIIGEDEKEREDFEQLPEEEWIGPGVDHSAPQMLLPPVSSTCV